ncbi:hypothetical protein NPIL_432801, partial [Nephila pilipes]
AASQLKGHAPEGPPSAPSHEGSEWASRPTRMPKKPVFLVRYSGGFHRGSAVANVFHNPTRGSFPL